MINPMQNVTIAVHGGAGTILRSSMTADLESKYRQGLCDAITAGMAILEKGGSSLDAVAASVESLENCPLFNAGKGSVFTAEGRHEMDAAIMEGRTRQAGAVAGVRAVKNPIALAKKVLQHSDHVLLIGEGAEQFGKIHDITIASHKYFHDDYRYGQWQKIKGSQRTQLDHTPESKGSKYGTVGAVALDKNGSVAAATSTGGLTNKRFGRVGDSPLIGIGNYANDLTCAVSCTGHGEYFIRGVVAYDISCLMEYKGLSLQKACDEAIYNRLSKLGGDGGVIGIDAEGNLALTFNSAGMYRGYQSVGQEVVTAIYKVSVP